MITEAVNTLRTIYTRDSGAFSNKAQLTISTAKLLNPDNIYLPIVLQAIDMNVATLVASNVKSSTDTDAIKTISQKLSLTWREELADQIVNIFVQAKFGSTTELNAQKPLVVSEKKPSLPPLIPDEKVPAPQLNEIIYDKRIFTIENQVLIKFSNKQTRATIPKGVTAIAEKAFFNCHNLTSVTIPVGVVSIGKFAFAECSSLTEIIIPEGVTLIDDCAFAWCSGLKSVIIEKNGKSIGKSTFMECINLTSVTIHEGVTHINQGVFTWCDKLKNIFVPSTLKTIGESEVNVKSGVITEGDIWNLLTQNL